MHLVLVGDIVAGVKGVARLGGEPDRLAFAVDARLAGTGAGAMYGARCLGTAVAARIHAVAAGSVVGDLWAGAAGNAPLQREAV